MKEPLEQTLLINEGKLWSSHASCGRPRHETLIRHSSASYKRTSGTKQYYKGLGKCYRQHTMLLGLSFDSEAQIICPVINTLGNQLRSALALDTTNVPRGEWQGIAVHILSFPGLGSGYSEDRILKEILTVRCSTAPGCFRPHKIHYPREDRFELQFIMVFFQRSDRARRAIACRCCGFPNRDATARPIASGSS